MVNDNDLAHAFDALWSKSSEYNWLYGRLGYLVEGGYLYDVPNLPGYVYVNKGIEGDEGVVTAIDRIGVAHVPGNRVKMRREFGHLIIAQAEQMAVGTGSSGATTLDALTDVTLSGATDGQMLQYNASTGQWVNVAPPGGGSGGAPVPHTLDPFYGYHSGQLPWVSVDTTGSSLADIDDRQHDRLLGITPNQHHMQVHDVLGADHTVVGSQYQIVGLTAPNDLGLFNSSSNPGSAAALLRTDAAGSIAIGGTLFTVAAPSRTVSIDAPLFVVDGSANTVTIDTSLLVADGDTDTIVIGGTTTFNDDITVNQAATFNGSVVRFNTDPQLNADLDFIGGNRSITGSNGLTLAPLNDLTLNPGGIIAYPPSQESKTTTFTDTVSGIAGFRLNSPLSDNIMQLSIGAIKADELSVKRFVADEARVTRGEEFWTYSFGIVQEEFVMPDDEGNVEVWFEESPGLGSGKLFLPDHWLLLRTIDWELGLEVRRVWFQVVDADGTGTVDWVDRQGQTDAHPARQKWRLKRKYNVLPIQPGYVVKPAEVMVDFGLPAAGVTPGQGVVHINALYKSDGPYVQVETFDKVLASGVPDFINHVRMGNLNGTADYTAIQWGFIAGDNLGTTPQAGFSGVAIDSEAGTRLFNTDLVIYRDNIKHIELERTRGLYFREATASGGSNGLDIAWYTDLDDRRAETRRAMIASYSALGSSYPTSELQLTNTTPGDDVNITSTVTVTASGFDGKGAGLVVSSDAFATQFEDGHGYVGSYAALNADQVEVSYKLVARKDNERIAEAAVLTVRQFDGEIATAAGAMLSQGGAGDAVIHWRLQDPFDFHGTRYYTAGIDNDDGDKFKISASDRLGVSFGDFFIYDPATGTVTINGWSPTGSTPPSGLVAPAGGGILLAGSNITVDSSVARTTTDVTAGVGLEGGGSIASDIELRVRLKSASGLERASDGIAISDTLAGYGLKWITPKVLAVDTSVISGGSGGGEIITAADSGLQGGGTVYPLTLAIKLATNSGLELTDGIGIPFSLAGSGLSMSAGKVLSINPLLAGDGLLFALGHINVIPGSALEVTADNVNVKLGTNSGLSTASGLVILPATAGNGLLMTAGVIDVVALPAGGLTANTNDLQIKLPATAGLTTDATGLYVKLPTNSGLFKDSSGLYIPTSFAGDGLVLTAGVVNVVALAAGGLTSNPDSIEVKLPTNSGLAKDTSGLYIAATLAGNGLSWDAALKVASVNVGNGLEIVSDAVRVNQAFAFTWTAQHQFNVDPQLSANLDFIAADRNITTSGTFNLSVLPGGNLVLAPVGKYVYPEGTVLTNLGAYNRKWSTFYASELYVESLVASKVMSTIGGRVMVTNTNVVAATMTAAQTTIDLKYNDPGFINGTFVLLEDFVAGVPWFEVIKLTSVGTLTGSVYRYTVVRNQKAGGTARAWPIGSAVASLGTVADNGYIDLSALATVHDQIGPTVTIYARKGGTQTWNNTAPVVTMGNLAGFAGSGSSTFGFATGNDLTLSPSTGFSGLVADTAGLRTINTDIRMFSGVDMVAEFDKAGDLGFQVGSFGYIHWHDDLGDGTSSPTNDRAHIGVDNPVPAAPNSTMLIYSKGYAGSFTNGAIRLFGQNSALANYNIWLDAGGIYFGSGNTAKSQTGGFITDSIQYFSGNVGIGTLAPDYLLDVQGNNASDLRVRIANTNYAGAAGAATTLEFGTGGPSSSIQGAALIKAIKTDTYNATGSRSARLSFSTMLAGVYGEGMTILANNRVGLSNSAPVTDLHIGPNTPIRNPGSGLYIAPNAAMTQMNLSNAAGQEIGMMAHSNGINYIGSWSNNDLRIRTNNADRLTISAGGTVSAAGALAVGTDLTVTGAATVTGVASLAGTMTLNPPAGGVSTAIMNELNVSAIAPGSVTNTQTWTITVTVLAQNRRAGVVDIYFYGMGSAVAAGSLRIMYKASVSMYINVGGDNGILHVTEAINIAVGATITGPTPTANGFTYTIAPSAGTINRTGGAVTGVGALTVTSVVA